MKKFLVVSFGALVGALAAAAVYKAVSKPQESRSKYFNRGHRRIAKKKTLVMRRKGKKMRFNHAEHPTHGVERTPARERAAV